MMKRTALVLLFLALSMPWALSASAGISQGDNEISIAGNYMMPDEGDDTLTIFGRYGYFFTDALSAGVGGYFMMTSGDSDFKNYFLQIDARYHFLTQWVLVPYVGAQVGYTWIDSGGFDESGYGYGGVGGVKYFFSEKGSFFAEYAYNVFVVDSNDTNTGSLNFGLSLLF